MVVDLCLPSLKYVNRLFSESLCCGNKKTHSEAYSEKIFELSEMRLKFAICMRNLFKFEFGADYAAYIKI